MNKNVIIGILAIAAILLGIWGFMSKRAAMNHLMQAEKAHMMAILQQSRADSATVLANQKTIALELELKKCREEFGD